MLKNFVRKILSYIGLNIRFSVVPGLSIFGINIHPDPRKGVASFRGNFALEHCLKLDINNVLDVGSGGGEHAKMFLNNGLDVVCVDYGTSVYYQESNTEGLNIIYENIINFESEKKFDLIWASHVIEHQQNVGLFINKLIDLCADNGYLCITIPDPHRHLWGGHLTIWSPGLLAYNIALCGCDLSNAVFIRGTLETSILFQLKKIDLPKNLSFDSGDIKKLEHLLPSSLTENSDPWKIDWI
tara:strand:+ start:30220 stop:30942 length:723 start_codon:yes stop_codon:yes gene_type:complete